MAKAKTKKMLVLKSGDSYEILDERGRYYKCKGTQFRKSNREIDRIEPIKKEVEENADH